MVFLPFQLLLATEVRDRLSSVRWPDWTWPDFNPGEAGIVAVLVGLLLLAFYYRRRWVKRKGFRMVLKDRNDKKHAYWLEIIQDGIDEYLAKGRISQKEANEMFAEAATKMKLFDLVPKKRLAPMVKASLKRDRALREQARKAGTYVEVSPNPGGPPTPIVETPTKFRERLGKTAGKFW